MSELKIKVGLELDDDIKELIHREVIRQLQEYSNCSVMINGDNFTWSVIHKDDETSKVFYTCDKYTFKKDEYDINKLKQDIDELKCKINTLIK